MSASFQSDKAEPNLVPILDMVFQLITFFMLVINFKTASMDLSLRLPVVGSARPVDAKGIGELLILNIDNNGNLNVYGERKADIETYIKSEGTASRLASGVAYGEELLATVVVRADRDTKFAHLMRIIKACQDEGYRKFNYRAMDKEQGT